MTGRRPVALGALAMAVAALVGGACSPKAGSAEELCAALGDGRSFRGLFEQGFDPTDPQRATAQLQAAKVDLEELHRAAPNDVRDDLEAEIRYVEAALGVLDDADPDDPAAIVAAINALDDERRAAEVAGLELQAYQDAHCRAATSTTGSSGSTGSTGSTAPAG